MHDSFLIANEIIKPLEKNLNVTYLTKLQQKMNSTIAIILICVLIRFMQKQHFWQLLCFSSNVTVN